MFSHTSFFKNAIEKIWIPKLEIKTTPSYSTTMMDEALVVYIEGKKGVIENDLTKLHEEIIHCLTNRSSPSAPVNNIYINTDSNINAKFS